MADLRRLDTAAAAAAAAALVNAIWQSEQVTSNLLRALDHAGCYAYGAYDGDDLVGASVAFLGDGPHLHSHITGVVPGARGRGVGYALKQHQRAWALERGIGTITWTFDPLVRRNAAFNITRLGALPVRYLVDFYGPMDDGINRGDETDRLYVAWDLRAPRPPVPPEGRRVAVPEDVEALRRNDPEAARRWRHTVRDDLGGALAEGWQVVAFDGGYVLAPPRAAD